MAILSCRVESVQETFHAGSLSDYQIAFVTGSGPQFQKLSAPFEFGEAHTDLIPPQPTSLAGFGGAARRLIPPNFTGIGGYFTYCLPFTEIDTAPPRAKVLLWTGTDTDGVRKPFVIINLDLVAVSSDVSKRLIEAINRDFPQDNINLVSSQVVATHTHSSIAGISLNPLWGAFACDRYSQNVWDFFEASVLNAYRQARLNLKAFAQTKRRGGALPNFNQTRFPNMQVDDRYLEKTFLDPGNNEIGCLFLYSVHPTRFGQSKRILSADIVGNLERAQARQRQDRDCYFFNSAVGNAEPKNSQNIAEYADSFVGSALELGDSIPVSVGDIKFGQVIVDLPKAQPNFKACKIEPLSGFISTKFLDQMPKSSKIGIMHMDETLFIFFPGEAIFPVQKQFEIAIRNKFPRFQEIRLVSLANDYLGYVVDDTSYSETTLESCSTLYGSQVGNILLAKTLELLEAF